MFGGARFGAAAFAGVLEVVPAPAPVAADGGVGGRRLVERDHLGTVRGTARLGVRVVFVASGMVFDTDDDEALLVLALL